jgi:hypothetical protein
MLDNTPWTDTDNTLDRLARLAGRCAKAIGRAFFDGMIAYGSAMCGVPWPVVAEETTPTSEPSESELDPSDAPFRDVDELIDWLNAQSDRVR